MPPNAYKVPGLIDELLDWLNNSTDEMYPIIIAGILHYELVHIHPLLMDMDVPADLWQH